MDAARRAAIERDVREDLQLVPRAILYLEGVTDPEIFLSLVGATADQSRLDATRYTHESVLIRGLAEGGSGSKAVEAHVSVARDMKATAYGFQDGDGASLAELTTSFDAPFAGPFFRWKAYSIENVLVQSGWPSALGAPPNWAKELRAFAPYVAINRMVRAITATLAELGIDRFRKPIHGQPLLQESDVARDLGQSKDLLAGIDVQQRFREEAKRFRELDEGSMHADLDGKWLLDVWAPSYTKKSSKHCRDAWTTATSASGGHPEVVALWKRLFP